MEETRQERRLQEDMSGAGSRRGKGMMERGYMGPEGGGNERRRGKMRKEERSEREERRVGNEKGWGEGGEEETRKERGEQEETLNTEKAPVCLFATRTFGLAA